MSAKIHNYYNIKHKITKYTIFDKIEYYFSVLQQKNVSLQTKYQ